MSLLSAERLPMLENHRGGDPPVPTNSHPLCEDPEVPTRVVKRTAWT